MMSSPIPPLLGDGNGRYRVKIVGNSGAGKSTTGEALARMLNVPYISMDRLFWEPGWVKTSKDTFNARLREALDQQPDGGWVADGNYDRRGGLMVLEESTDIIWLDPPLALYLPRLIWRTFLRLFRLREPCSPGCLERPSEVFLSKESIIWWCISNHWRVRKDNRERMQVIGLTSGTDIPRRRMRRFGGWGSELKSWMADVGEMLRAKKE